MLRPNFPIMTARLVLRAFGPEDLDALFAIRSRADVTRYLYGEPGSRDDVAEVLDRAVRQTALAKEGDRLGVAVVLPDGRLIGEVSLVWRSEEHGTGEVGFVFHPDYHGHGYAGEAATELLRLGFEGAGLHRIVGRPTAAMPRRPG
jgi:RimJ/RimL family protein N-acetyltransferase